jgi:hypothetical protein
VVLLVECFYGTKFQYRLAACFGERHSRAEVFFGLPGKMIFDFLEKLLLVTLAREQVAKPNEDAS